MRNARNLKDRNPVPNSRRAILSNLCNTLVFIMKSGKTSLIEMEHKYVQKEGQAKLQILRSQGSDKATFAFAKARTIEIRSEPALCTNVRHGPVSLTPRSENCQIL